MKNVNLKSLLKKSNAELVTSQKNEDAIIILGNDEGNAIKGGCTTKCKTNTGGGNGTVKTN